MGLRDLREKFQFAHVPDVARPLGRPLEILWSFKVKATADELWPFVADTSRFNRELGLQERRQKEVDGSIIVDTKFGPFPQQWVEEPWTWVTNKHLSMQRVHKKGFIKYSWAYFILEPLDSKNTAIHMYFGWIPKNFFARLFIKWGFSPFKEKYAAIFSKAQKFIADQKEAENPHSDFFVSKTYEKSKNLHLKKKKLLESPVSKKVAQKLCQYVETADPMDLNRIKVKPLALKWEIDESDLVQTCLYATRVGILTLTWDVICPHCRGPRSENQSLSEIKKEDYCKVCKIDFDTSDENAVEVIFHVHPSVREIPEQQYCSAEPTKKEHIKIQISVKPGESLKLLPQLGEGTHRVRTLTSRTSFVFEAKNKSSLKSLSWDGSNQKQKRVESNLTPTIEVTNKNKKPEIFIVEEMWWNNEALRPGQVFGYPEFRDLFSAECLSADVKLALGNQCIVFTDIVGSTAFYENSGDAVAFNEVKKHFKELSDAITSFNGVVVKTIGDAVMGSFHTTKNALDACLEIQNRFQKDRKDTPIRLRISLHYGKVMAVQLNTGLDYFGKTVNTAAKLQACAEGGQIALSESAFDLLGSYLKHMNYQTTEFHPKGAKEPLKVITIDTFSAGNPLSAVPKIS